MYPSPKTGKAWDATAQMRSGRSPIADGVVWLCWVYLFNYFMLVSLKSVLHEECYPKIRRSDSIIISTSFSELFLPNDNLIVPFASSGFSPIACNT